MIRYGPAGFQYKDWEGVVYPDPRPKGFDPLAYLASYFDTIEINSTFYGPARPSTIDSWVRRVEHNPRFRFTAKLYKRFTHERTTTWTRDEVAEVRAGFDPLLESGRLGAVLLQFPWSFRRTPENREWLADVVDTFAHYPLVLEVRHSTWNTPQFFEGLAERGIGFVNIDQPLFKNSIKPTALSTARVGYVRVHGRNYQDWFRADAGRDARYDYLYTADELKPWADRTREIAAEPATEELYVVTNNHYRGKAVANALMLQSMVEGRTVPAPPPLVAEYADVLAGFADPADPRSALSADDREPFDDGDDADPVEEIDEDEPAPRKRPAASKSGSKSATSKSTPSKSAPSKSATSKSAPSKSTPSKSAPSKAAASKPAPSKSATSKSAPSKSARAKAAPKAAKSRAKTAGKTKKDG